LMSGRKYGRPRVNSLNPKHRPDHQSGGKRTPKFRAPFFVVTILFTLLWAEG
jgi:hypothetical protein